MMRADDALLGKKSGDIFSGKAAGESVDAVSVLATVEPASY
jgi:hypothetical protein